MGGMRTSLLVSCFTLKMGRTGCTTKVLKDVQFFFCIFDVEIQITKKIDCYSTRKSSKWRVYTTRSLFNLENRSDWPWGPTDCISKFFTYVHKKFWLTWCKNANHPKKWYHTKIIEIEGICASRLVWPRKWVGVAMTSSWMHRKGIDVRPLNIWHFYHRNLDRPKNGLL